jgi:hypothetical protein
MRKRLETEETIRESHGEKSNLLLEAQILIGIGNPEEAIERYALAAPMEARLARYYTRTGEKDMAARHWFSAAICYPKSGSLWDALKVFNALGRDKDTPGQYKGDALLWATRLRQQQRETLETYGHSVQSAA